MSSPSPDPTVNESLDLSHEVQTVSAQLQFNVVMPAPSSTSSKKKKAAAPKTKVEVKNKEFPFIFKATPDNYLSFLSTILEKHGQQKYTLVTNNHRFSIKMLMGKKAKKDGVQVDIDKFAEFRDFTSKILEEEPTKLVVFVSLDDVKRSAKKGGNDDTGSSGDEKSSESGDKSTKNGIERELARIRGLLEKRYGNPSDSGYTFITDEGEKIPLTPSMLSEWSRAVYDGNVNIHQPPNTITFDPKTRRRSLFHHDQPASTATDSTAPGFSAVASIIHDIVNLVGPKNAIHPPSTPVRW